MSYLKDIYTKTKDDDRNYIVTVILDGENAWENYPEDAHDFFENLYSTLGNTPWLKTTRISSYLNENWKRIPELKHVWPGSWINKDYSTWIGEEEENIAWKYAYDCYVAYTENYKKVSKEVASKAYDELLALLGSDWYWWYGKDQDSGMDSTYDRLFRTHLKNVYSLLGIKVPEVLSSSILTPEKTEQNTPKDFFTPDLDGVKEPAWDKYAGIISIKNGGGVMQKSKRLDRLYYCFDSQNLYLGLPEPSKDIKKLIIYARDGENELIKKDPTSNIATGMLMNTKFSIDLQNSRAYFLKIKNGKWNQIWSSSIKNKNFIEMVLPLNFFISNSLTFMLAEPEKMLSKTKYRIEWPPEESLIKEFSDKKNDDFGYGHITYPGNKAFKKGSFDLRSVKITETKDDYRFYISLGNIENPWHSTSGFSVQTIDIYFCQKNGNKVLLPGRDASIKNSGWKYCATIEGWESKLFESNKKGFTELKRISPSLSFDKKYIVFSINKKYISKIDKYGLIVCVLGQDGYSDKDNLRIRKVVTNADDWHFGGRYKKSDSNIIDILDPSGNQKKQLSPQKSTVLLTPISLF